MLKKKKKSAPEKASVPKKKKKLARKKALVPKIRKMAKTAARADPAPRPSEAENRLARVLSRITDYRADGPAEDIEEAMVAAWRLRAAERHRELAEKIRIQEKRPWGKLLLSDARDFSHLCFACRYPLYRMGEKTAVAKKETAEKLIANPAAYKFLTLAIMALMISFVSVQAMPDKTARWLSAADKLILAPMALFLPAPEQPAALVLPDNYRPSRQELSEFVGRFDPSRQPESGRPGTYLVKPEELRPGRVAGAMEAVEFGQASAGLWADLKGDARIFLAWLKTWPAR